ncbi:MAG: VWA domain-containing protein, partial [Pirellulales bacterium]|nr:VWA domain-containing protein [Pirellulales bacterium]
VAEEPGRATGIVLRKFTPEGEYFEDADEAFAAESSAAVASNSPPKTQLPDEEAPAAKLEGLIAKPPTIGSGGLGGDAPGAGDDPTKGHGHQRLPGGKLRTNIYGVVGEGSKFVYVFDRSESMYGAQLESAKRELTASLDHLERLHQFGIIFYNHEVSVFNPSRLSFGDSASKVRAQRYIQGVTAAGATNHFPALMAAVRLSPDVIFLLTDGERHNDPTYDELRRIRNANSGTQIHVIQFVQGSVSTRGNALVQLARENGGQHKFINTWKFK